MAVVCVHVTEQAFYEEAGFKQDQKDKESVGGGEEAGVE